MEIVKNIGQEVFKVKYMFKEMFALIQNLLFFHMRAIQWKRWHLHTTHAQFFIMTEIKIATFCKDDAS